MTMSPDGSTKRCSPQAYSRRPCASSPYAISDLLQDLDDFKPDLATYNKQREATLQSDALVAAATGGELGPVLHDNGLYRDANSFVYADHKPTDDQVDRMISKLNSEYVHSETGCGAGWSAH